MRRAAKCASGRSKGHWIASPGRRIVPPGRVEGGFVPGAIRFLRSESALTHSLTLQAAYHSDAITVSHVSHVSQWCHHTSSSYFSFHLPPAPCSTTVWDQNKPIYRRIKQTNSVGDILLSPVTTLPELLFVLTMTYHKAYDVPPFIELILNHIMSIFHYEQKRHESTNMK